MRPYGSKEFDIISKTLVISLSVIGTVNVLAFMTTMSPAFSTTSTALAPASPSQSSATQDISNLFKGIEQFLAPSGYEQAREDPSYAINIPFSELGF
jgi:hypothetical protein